MVDLAHEISPVASVEGSIYEMVMYCGMEARRVGRVSMPQTVNQKKSLKLDTYFFNPAKFAVNKFRAFPRASSSKADRLRYQ